MLLFNPDPHPADFALAPGDWRLLLDSSGATDADGASLSTSLLVPARAVLVLRQADPSFPSIEPT